MDDDARRDPRQASRGLATCRQSFPPHALIYASRIEDDGDVVKLSFDVSPNRMIHVENGRFEVLVARSEKMDGYTLRRWRYVEPVKVAIHR